MYFRPDDKDNGVALERVLQLPVPVVLVVLWITGAMLEGVCAAVLYASWLLLRLLA